MPHIAVIEDEPAIRAMYAFKLRSLGYEVSEAANGLEGLQMLQKQKPDLILLDLKMPELDGTEMLRQLRSHPWGEDVLTIILTNISQSEAPMELRFLQVEKYIVKAHSTPSQVAQEVYDTLIRHNKMPASHSATAGQKGP